MPTTIYDSSLLTKRARDKAVANSFLTRIRSPNNTSGSAPYLGIYDNSIINTVSVGSRTEYKKCDGGATLVSIGCPCSITKDVNGNIVIPSEVSNIRYIIGSIILKWDAPLVGTGPFTYLVTPYYQGVALQSVTTTELEYRFTNLEESKPYTFTVCAMNSKGQSPVVRTVDPIIMPPSALSKIMSGLPDTSDVTPAIKYIINAGLNEMLRYVTAFNLGPTRSSRIMYLWTMSIVSAWNWVRAGGAVTGLHDGWNWSNKSSTLLSDQESATWLCSVIDYITLKVTPIVNPAIPYKPYVSIYNCPVSTVNTVKNKGNWEIWKANIDGWLQIRASDGSADAATQMPENSANWGKTIVDNKVTDFSTFGDVTKWTRLTVQGKKQGYLTYNWGNVTSTCLDADDYDAIKAAVAPLTGDARADEVTEVLNISKILDDTRKMIAEFWAGGPLTSSPPCIMIWLWKEYMRSLPTITSNKILYSLLDLSIHLFEGGRVTWALKKEYMEARPIQEIRRRYASNPSDPSNTIKSWNGDISGALWIPYQEANFVTPPFADFPSGHSHFSKAFALTMTKWFGENIHPIVNSTVQHIHIQYDRMKYISPIFKVDQSGVFGVFEIPAGTSGVEKGVVPATNLELAWNTWDDMASSSGMSRLYGGIHCLTAHTSSQTVASIVNSKIETTWNISASV